MARRARYTVEFADGTRTVILAYSAEGAREWLSHRNPVAVRKGDYRVEAQRAAARENGGFNLDREAFDAAVALLDLKWPVRVRFNGREGQTNGNYRLRVDASGQCWHDIMLKSYRTAEQASRTLWHELTHAAQAERAGGFAMWEQERRIQARWTYAQRPIEREARQMAEDMADLQLCG